MTVTYNYDAKSTGFKLLFRWRGSVWKNILSELIFWCVAYSVVAVLIHCAFHEHHKEIEEFRQQLENRMKDYPLVFLLGFFVSVVFARWVEIFKYIGFTDNLALVLSTTIKGSDVETKLLKRNIIRYAVLSQALVFRDISLQCRQRFPDIQALIDCGLLTMSEYQIFTENKLSLAKFWIPIQWALRLIDKARGEGKISCDLAAWNTQEKVREFRNNLSRLACYDWVPVPLGYPQIVYIAIRCYFCLMLVSAQIIDIVPEKLKLEGYFNVNNTSLNSTMGLYETDDEKHTHDWVLYLQYIPFVSFVKFILFIGWARVAETLINPFGMDDDDYECSHIIDRNLTIGFAIIEGTKMPPTDEVDAFWCLEEPQPLDTLNGKNKFKKETPYSGSCADVDMSGITNDPKYQMQRERRRTFIKRLNSQSSMSGNCTPIHTSSNNIFFGNHKLSTQSARSLNFKPETLFPFHHLDNLTEVDESSRRESIMPESISPTPDEETHEIVPKENELEEVKVDEHSGDKKSL